MAEPLKRLSAEFVIIVLGVLVALAFDDLQTRRGDTRLEQYYLGALHADLLTDIAALERSLAHLDTLEVLGHRFSSALADPMRRTLNPDLSHIDVEWEQVPALMGRLRRIEPSRATYDELLASGHLRLLKSEQIRASLTAYYLYAERAIAREYAWASPLSEAWYGKLREKGLLIIDLRADSTLVDRLRDDPEARSLIRAMGAGKGYLQDRRLQLIE